MVSIGTNFMPKKLPRSVMSTTFLSVAMMLMVSSLYVAGQKSQKKMHEVCDNFSIALSQTLKPYNPPTNGRFAASGFYIDITVDFVPAAFVTINDVEKVFSMQGEVIMNWKLPVSWFPSEIPQQMSSIFGACRIPQSEIWRPSLEHVNRIGQDSPFKTGSSEFVAVIGEQLEVYWEVFGQFDSSCTMDFAKFPFDTQTCKIEIGSIGYWNTEQRLVIDPESRNAEIAIPANDVWEMLNRTISKDNDLKDTVIFSFILQRNPKAYYMNMFLPMALLMVLQLSVFAMPAEMPDRSALSMTAFFASSVLLSVLADYLPVTANIIYLAANFAGQTTVGVIITIYTTAMCRVAEKYKDVAVKNKLFTIYLTNLMDLIAFLLSLIAYSIVNVICIAKMVSP